MDDYLRRTRTALDEVDAALATLAASVTTTLGVTTVPKSAASRLHEALDRLTHASKALRLSFSHIERTALDVVDLQSRLEGETASLASALRLLGETVEQSAALRERLITPCGQLEEAASALATATFPSAVEGLAAVNRALWDFQGPVWKAYERKLAEVVGRRTLTPLQVSKIEATAQDVRARFEAVNSLIDQLAGAAFHDRKTVATMVADARNNLTRALSSARSRANDVYKPFHGVLGQAESVAGRVLRQLERCRIPLFPHPDALDDAKVFVEPGLYTGLSGVGRFALLNILSCLRTIPGDGEPGHLLSPAFVRHVFAVFPDRIYLEATPSLLKATEALTRVGAFKPAPAALHRFREGSVKQQEHRKGNLQFSYERAGDVVRVDADIDLYRGPVSHLFGEVLINHLTGSTTDQFAVRTILDGRGVTPIGGFEVWSPIG